jgi:hypothetical protein
MTKEEEMWRKNIGGPRKHMGLTLEKISRVVTKKLRGLNLSSINFLNCTHNA